MSRPGIDDLHCFTLDGGAEVWRGVDGTGERVINLTINTPENGISLSLRDAALLALLASDIYAGRMRRIDRMMGDRYLELSAGKETDRPQ